MRRFIMNFRQFLYSKIHGGCVTECDLHYEGSCGLGPDLLVASGIAPLEKISVLNVTTGARLETYVIPSPKKGDISLNGAAARYAAVGDKVIILSYIGVSEDKVRDHKARIVILNSKNEVVSSRDESAHS
jgi:aspartate 1-decarboxylase